MSIYEIKDHHPSFTDFHSALSSILYGGVDENDTEGQLYFLPRHKDKRSWYSGFDYIIKEKLRRCCQQLIAAGVALENGAA